MARISLINLRPNCQPFRRLSRPHFGQAVTWALLYVATVATPTDCPVPVGNRAGHATILWLLPDTVLREPLILSVAHRILELFAILWACRLLIPWSCWG